MCMMNDVVFIFADLLQPVIGEQACLRLPESPLHRTVGEYEEEWNYRGTVPELLGRERAATCSLLC